jgi:hypothetical protein
LNSTRAIVNIAVEHISFTVSVNYCTPAPHDNQCMIVYTYSSSRSAVIVLLFAARPKRSPRNRSIAAGIQFPAEFLRVSSCVAKLAPDTCTVRCVRVTGLKNESTKQNYLFVSGRMKKKKKKETATGTRGNGVATVVDNRLPATSVVRILGTCQIESLLSSFCAFSPPHPRKKKYIYIYIYILLNDFAKFVISVVYCSGIIVLHCTDFGTVVLHVLPKTCSVRRTVKMCNNIGFR